MTQQTERSPLSDALGSATLSAIIGGVSYAFTRDDPDVRALGAIGGLIAGLLAIRAGVFVLAWLARAAVSGAGVAFRHYGFRKAAALVTGLLLGGGGVSGIQAFGSESIEPWHYAIPLAAGIAVCFLPHVAQRILGTSIVNRLVVSGGKPQEDFAGGRYVKRLSASLRSKHHADGRYLAQARYVGRSLTESSLWGRHVWLGDAVSEVVLACTGSGKGLDIIVNGCLWAASAMYISTKFDIAHAILGRRSDPYAWYGKERPDGSPGIDVRGITHVTSHIPGARSVLLDPDLSSLYARLGQCSYHTLLSDIDPRDPHAASMFFALMTASVPVNERATDPFWQNFTRLLSTGACAFQRVMEPDVSKHTLPHVVDLLLGIDERGRSDPARFAETLLRMRKCNAVGGIIQAAASGMDQLGDNAFGAISAEVRNAFRWVMLLRDHLIRPSTFSYAELALSAFPLSVFLIQPSLAKSEAAPYVRSHLALAMAVLKRKGGLNPPVCLVADEAAQWAKGTEIASSAMILRSYGIKQILYLQNHDALIQTFGEHGANEILSSASERYFGVNDFQTASLLSRRLGEREGRDGRHPLVSPQDILRELDPTSPLQYCLPYAGPALRLERRAHKTIRTKEGLRLRGLPFHGMFDEF